uniref:Uncharacterized protein n=1 Tax=Plectus sambesii TaxID=2011161 RepID=A0A914VML4_9BILA
MSVCRRQEAHIVDLYKTLEEQQFQHPADSLNIPIRSGPPEIVSCGSSRGESGASQLYLPALFDEAKKRSDEKMAVESDARFRSKTGTL